MAEEKVYFKEFIEYLREKNGGELIPLKTEGENILNINDSDID